MGAAIEHSPFHRPIGKGEIFAHSALTFAFVNLKPIVPGHVLLSPKRPAPRFQDLTPEASPAHAQRTRDLTSGIAADGMDSVASVCGLSDRPQETADLWQMAQLVAQRIEPHYGCSSATFAMQDGPEAGQTVAHVHIHLLPRKNGQFAKARAARGAAPGCRQHSPSEPAPACAAAERRGVRQD